MLETVQEWKIQWGLAVQTDLVISIKKIEQAERWCGNTHDTNPQNLNFLTVLIILYIYMYIYLNFIYLF